MKFLYLVILLNSFSLLVQGQTTDNSNFKKDTTSFSTPNPFLVKEKNYELINSSFITGNSYAIIRSEDNPRILVDGIPVNPWLTINTHHNEFLGSMNMLSYDLQKVNVNTLQSDDRIISGMYNNGLSFSTNDIKLGKSSPRFEVNNFSTLAYQALDTLGFSTMTNFNMQQGFEKFGYRVSINSGFQNDYIPENGLQRFGGNLKLKYEPFKRVAFTGFIDYTTFQDFKRTGENDVQASRLFSYLNTDILLTNWLSFHGKYSLNNVSDSTSRYIQYDGIDWYGKPYSENYLENKNQEYKTTYLDLGLRFKKTIFKKALLNFDFGYSNNNVDHSMHYLSVSRQSYSEYGSHSELIYKPVTTEQKYYSSLALSGNSFKIQYLFDITNSGFGKYQADEDENKSRNNHLLSLEYDFITNNDKFINDLGLSVDYGKLMNYKILSYSPDWIINHDNDNLQLAINSSILKKRLDIDLSYYQKEYKEFTRLFHVFNGLYFSQDIGRITKSGYNIDGTIHLIKHENLNWLAEFSYSRNNVKLATRDELVVYLADTVINNKIINVGSRISYKNLYLGFTLEGKTGFDVSLYQKSISVAEPIPTYEIFQTTGVTNNGIPVTKRVENEYEYITDTDYFILKQVELDYQFNDAKNNKYLIGLHYNKMRRLYQYVNDINEYNKQFQSPSFFSTLSLSFKMVF